MHTPAKVFVIDDEASSLYLVQSILENEYEVSCFDTIESSLKGIEVDKPDLVILDVVLPVSSGYKLLADLKRSPNYQDIPVILLSGKVVPAEVAYGLELGASAYMCKPVNVEELLQTTKDCLHICS